MVTEDGEQREGRKGSDLQMAQRAIVAKRQDVQDTQDFSNGLQRSLRKQEVQTTLPNCGKGTRRGASPEGGLVLFDFITLKFTRMDARNCELNG